MMILKAIHYFLLFHLVTAFTSNESNSTRTAPLPKNSVGLRSSQSDVVETLAIDPDTGKGTVEIIQARGYNVEEHFVTTADGYILSLFRIPHGRNEKGSAIKEKKPVVYLIHGLLDSSFTWVNNYPHQSLGFLLADQGYDVWLGNNRGTTYSKRHAHLNIHSKEFWQFSWDEMATYDMPANLHYILDFTGAKTLSYVGHSEGTMQAFAGFSMDQELAKRVSYFGALAPVTYVAHQKSPLFELLANIKLDELMVNLGVKEFMPSNTIIQNLLGKFGCDFLPSVCNSVLNLFNGPSYHTNASRIPVYVGQTPAGTSVRNMAHFAQLFRENSFRRYNHGCTCRDWIIPCPALFCKNKQVYGALDPPNYNVGMMKYPRTGLYHGTNDWLSTPTDFERTKALLPEGTVVNEKVAPFNHLDFTWASDANYYVYDDLIANIKKFEGKSY